MEQLKIETNNNNFATLLAELESAVNELDGDIPLERALELFERGMKLSSQLEKFLSAADQKVEILRRTADGEVLVEAHLVESIETSV